MTKCPKCGVENDERFAFCSACGSRIAPGSGFSGGSANVPLTRGTFAEPLASAPKKTKSSESRNFFSFKGRARRGLFWGIVAAAILFAIALSFVGPASDYFFERSSPIARNELSWAFQVPVYLAKVLLICVAASGCAVLTRRFHDINMPTWLAVVSFAIMVVCGVLSMKCAYRARLASPDRLIQKFRGESGGDLTEEGRALLSALVKESMTVSPEEEERYKTAAAGFGIACFVALLFNSLVGVVPGTSGSNRYGPPPAR